MTQRLRSPARKRQVWERASVCPCPFHASDLSRFSAISDPRRELNIQWNVMEYDLAITITPLKNVNDKGKFIIDY